MKRVIVLGALIQMLSAGAFAAEQDHSQHQHQPQVPQHQHDHASIGGEPTESERAHVPPPPPQHVMGEMSKEHMSEMMQMEDDAAFLLIQLDQFEWRDTEAAKAWEARAWYGGDYDKLWLETEGKSVAGEESGRIELLWDRIVTKWWSLQAGLRQDFGAGPSRTWAAVGVQGLAPYFFEVDAALYVGEQGRTAARLSAEYDLLITQRLILQPRFELEAFGKKDLENGIGSGLSDLELGLRLRYELRRELAPYVGAHWERKLGNTADVSRAAGRDASDLSFVVGVRAWF
jgi:copper resistance protein B